MKLEDMKQKSEDELKKLLLDLRKEQLNLRFQRTNGTLDNTATMRKTRRDIARVKTLLSQKQNEADAPKTAKAKKAPAKKTAKKAA